jgi:hypothetical protein
MYAAPVVLFAGAKKICEAAKVGISAKSHRFILCQYFKKTSQNPNGQRIMHNGQLTKSSG